MSVVVHALLSVLAAAIAIWHWAIRQPHPPDFRRTEERHKGPLIHSRHEKKSKSCTKVEDQLSIHKDLYFKLQNLESFPEILPKSRDLLISLLSETLAKALRSPEKSILAIESYSPQEVKHFLLGEHNKVLHLWEQYIQRRSCGQGPELFKSRNDAIDWLKQVAPVKYVDGAWLGHIHKITTPFGLRYITKNAWQILSEELGDGDLTKNHVYLYREMLRDIGCELPDGNSIDFIHRRHQLNSPRVWKAAIGQLLISLFPHEFLPEILGFNMHYELLTLETMKAAKELQEFNIRNYYFVLHISIDNADTGHTAMALHTVLCYMEMVRNAEGERAVEKTWRRIQAGYTLSEALGDGYHEDGYSTGVTLPLSELDMKVIKIFKSKSAVSQKIHCNSRVKIGGQTLVNWLNPEIPETSGWQLKFLTELGNFKPWVCRGDSSNSLLVRELSWNGKMFGAFTHNEVEEFKTWIDSAKPNSNPYWQFVSRIEISSSQALANQDVAIHHPVLPHDPRPDTRIDLQRPSTSPCGALQFMAQPPLMTSSGPRLSVFLPLWFTHPCLLENTIVTPFKTISPLLSIILRLLRAESGFAAEGHIVAGMDEPLRPDHSGLIELGLEIVQRRGLDKPKCLKDVLGDEENQDAHFAYRMLRWAMRPTEHLGLLLGLSRAFLDLEILVAESDVLLSEPSRRILRKIATRKADCLYSCLQALKSDDAHYNKFLKGYEIGRGEIEMCINQPH